LTIRAAARIGERDQQQRKDDAANQSERDAARELPLLCSAVEND